MVAATLVLRNPRRKSRRSPTLIFPLTPHATGQWVKKIKGKTYYFGEDGLLRADWQKVLGSCTHESDSLYRAVAPPSEWGTCALDACQKFSSHCE